MLDVTVVTRDEQTIQLKDEPGHIYKAKMTVINRVGSTHEISLDQDDVVDLIKLLRLFV